MSTVSREIMAPLAVRVPEGASAHVAARPFGRFTVRVRDGLVAASVGRASLQIEGDRVCLRARRPPRAAAVARRCAPAGFAAAALLFAAGLSSAGFLAACAVVLVMAVMGLLQALLARPEETTVHVADTYVVAVRRPLGLDTVGVGRLLDALEWVFPRPLADLVGRRVVVLEAPWGADRLAILRRAVVTRRVATTQALLRSLRPGAGPRLGCGAPR